ncbi:MAG TPA: hypothetical protein PK706_01840 [Xanthobacteraceae bacterium]|nr:hypothetical protein [Xanthobacteraceae bacterium]
MRDVRDIYQEIAEQRAELMHCYMTSKERKEAQKRLEAALAEAERRLREEEWA